MGTEKRTSNRINENASSKVTGRENWRHQPWELRQMQSLSLGAKKRMTFDRIKGWYETFDENVYFSYSGGKDSTVLLEMVAVFCKEYGYTLYVAFCDTGLEYPEIRIFAEANAKRIAEKYGINMVFVRLRPDMNFRDVLIEYGYPVISKEVLLQSTQGRFREWIEKGLVTVTETLGGIKTDYKYIIRYLEDLVREYNLKPQLICYDPHNASAFLSDLEAMGFDSISVTQTAKELNDATVDFRLEILAGNVEIEGMEVGKEGNKIVVPVDSLLVWSIANAKTISNNYGEIKIDKDITTERIDPIDAIIDAWKHAMRKLWKKLQTK